MHAQPVFSGQWQFWIDRGGTFTDVVALDPAGEIHTHKLLSENPEQYDDAAIAGIRHFLGLGSHEPIPAGLIASVKMGTTVATNALLERKGEPVVLLTHRGFRDALQIAYQNRPDIFARQIFMPEVLYREVIEIEGRVDVKGETLVEPDLEAARLALEAARARGFDSIAICLMHAWRYPQHERVLAQLARDAGFSQVSSSHECSGLIKFVARGQTTVVDAYLSPILRRYVEQVASQLPGVDLQFMQSHGGLTSAHHFEGRDAILSGPAGGIVGAVKTAAEAGFDRIIGFDMGGTSTDVSHYAGEYERSFETEVAGVRMRVPMLHIHTVAAGGGSIVGFDGLSLRVGPHSAGANPGPAAYRRGGPLTVTDCNVLLGRIQGDYFPAVFGPAGNEPLDTHAVEQAFLQLADALGRPVEDVAWGAMAIAVENMANAIKTISVQRGYDLAHYTLVSFGGAGGQHAALVAQQLGIRRVLLHPLSGVLSAYGMGLADQRVIEDISLEVPLTPDLDLSLTINALQDKSRVEIEARGARADALITSIQLRYQGADSTISLPLADHAALLEAFAREHQRRFGFIRDKRIDVAGITVEAISYGHQATQSAPPSQSATNQASALVRLYSAGSWHQAPLFRREHLAVDGLLHGPALVVESTGTIVVEDGWTARLTARGDLLLEMAADALMDASCFDLSKPDPVQLQLFNNRFMSIAEQMGVQLANTAHSVNIKERLDFSCALFDSRGQLIANAPHVPVHLGSMGESIRSVLDVVGDTLAEGDVYALNNPYRGGTHLPDITVVSPVFVDGQLRFFVASRGHHADVGGKTPGSMPPDSRHIEEEGVLLDCVQVVRGGEFLEPAFRKHMKGARYPARNVDENVADLQAQIAANHKGAAELMQLCREYGAHTVEAYMGHVLDYAEATTRRVLSKLQDGEFTYAMDSGAQISVRISIDPQACTACIDFAGTSDQLDSNFNAPASICRAATLYVLRTLVDEAIPLNDGFLRPVELRIPQGCMLNPVWPAAVVAGNVETSQCITDTLYGALGIQAASQGTMNNLTFGNRRYQYYETICGGTGAGPGWHGSSGVHSHMTNSRLTDPEILELRYPVILEAFHLRPGSGGNGRWRGGDGIVRAMRMREAMTVSMLSNHRLVAPYGMAGGDAGQCGRHYVRRHDGQIEAMASCDRVELSPGDSIVIETPGGGGYGEV